MSADVLAEQTGYITAPSVVTVILEAIEGALADLHTGLPAKVLKFDPTTQSCDVAPLIQRTFEDPDGNFQVVSLPPITNVPIVYPGGGGWAITWPLAPGDTVYLAFCERSMDEWLAGDGSEVDPFFHRKHDLSDAVAIATLRARSKSLKTLDANNLAIGREDGSVQILLTPTSAAIKAPTLNLDIGGTAISPSVLGDKLVQWLTATPYVCGAPGAPAALSPAAALTLQGILSQVIKGT